MATLEEILKLENSDAVARCPAIQALIGRQSLEETAADTNNCCPFLDTDFEVAAHPHGKFRQ